jgi:hypothetical protein
MARKGWELMADSLWHGTEPWVADGATFPADLVLQAIRYQLFSPSITCYTLFSLTRYASRETCIEPHPQPPCFGPGNPTRIALRLKPQAHIIHDRFYCNRRYAAATSLAASSARPAGRLAPRDLNILFQVCFGLSGLRMPVSRGVLTVSSRTVMNNVGWIMRGSFSTRDIVLTTRERVRG